MAEFRATRWRTRAGELVMYPAQPLEGSQRPAVVFLHGAWRRAEVFAPWADLLADVADVVLVDLPGHGQSEPIAGASVAAIADCVHEALRAALPGRQVLLVGESLGGLIALTIAGEADHQPVKAVFAADPPFTTAKLWSVAQTLRHHVALGNFSEFAIRLGKETFGVSGDEVEEIIYYPLVGQLRLPTVIATGDLALMPPRSVEGLTCLFDGVDRFVLERLYPGKVEIQQFQDCGHLLLIDAQDRCLQIITSMLANHVAGD
jgi:pimeloyl-ACP methyl ester carboxylesterase